MDRRLIDYKPELELAGAGAQSPAASSAESPVATADEYDEMAFATQLLEAASPAALADVLADLVARAGVGAGVAGPLARVLQRAARMVFPLNATRAPGDLKRKAAAIFGLELEGLSPEDKEFELARRFVRLASAAVAQARMRPPHDPANAVQRALLHAAREHAPGLLRQRPPAMAGRWRRHGNHLEVLDC